MTENCASCRFRRGIRCKRFPPSVALYPAVENPRRGNTYEATTIGWPAVEADDWCGEWKAKP
jgi:hypothetical protein